MGLNEGEGDPKLEKSQRATTHNQPATVSHPETRIHSTQKAPESQINPVQPGKDSSSPWLVSHSLILTWFKVIFYTWRPSGKYAPKMKIEMKNLAKQSKTKQKQRCICSNEFIIKYGAVYKWKSPCLASRGLGLTPTTEEKWTVD
jgi:hypothetical protein